MLKKCIFCLIAIFYIFVAHSETETIAWYVGDNLYTTTTCESGGDISLPNPPTKTGYDFIGWKAYTPVEYLQGTGTQYIDTGYIPNQDTGVTTKIQFDSVTNDQALSFGSGTSADKNAFECYIWSQRLSFNYNNAINQPPEYMIVGDTVIIDWNRNVIKYSINGIDKSTITRPYAQFSSPYQMRLFSITRPYSITSATSIGRIKIYYFQIYDNDVLVRDFIPVLDSDGVPALFDRVSGTFFYNAGTGQFITGPIITE